MEEYGKKIKNLRLKMGLTQSRVAKELDVTPGYISNVENGRTSMSLRMLIYYAKLMNVSLDFLVGELDSNYQPNATDNELIRIIEKLSPDDRSKLIKTLNLWFN